MTNEIMCACLSRGRSILSDMLQTKPCRSVCTTVTIPTARLLRQRAMSPSNCPEDTAGTSGRSIIQMARDSGSEETKNARENSHTMMRLGAVRVTMSLKSDTAKLQCRRKAPTWHEKASHQKPAGIWCVSCSQERGNSSTLFRRWEMRCQICRIHSARVLEV